MLKYKLSLINVWWSENQTDTRYFSTVNEQQNYFDRLTNGRKTVFVNFNMGDNITTSVIYKDNSERSVDELMKCNYCVVYQYNENEELLNTRYYYAKCYQDSNKQLTVDLRLDSIQTNYFKHKNTIKPCLIKRAHLDRWINDTYTPQLPNYKTFNTLPNSLLFKSEDIFNISKKIDSKETTTPLWTGYAEVDVWLKENVACWLYVFINNRSDDRDTYHNFACFDILTNNNDPIETRFFNTRNDLLNTQLLSNINYSVLCYPIYKKQSKKIKINNGNTLYQLDITDYNGDGITCYKSMNNNTSFVYCEKLSVVCPFDNSINYNFDENNNLILSKTESVSVPTGQMAVGNTYVTRFTETLFGYCSICLTKPKTKYTFGFSLNDYRMRYPISEIVGVEHNPLLNPKYYSSDIMTLNLHNNGSTGYEYDLLRLGQTSYLDIEYTETIQPEITRFYSRFKLPLFNGFLSENQNSDYIGDVGSFDGTLPMTNTQYADFIANNKNFWLQQNTNMLTSISSGVIAGVGNITGGNIVGGVEKLGSTALQTFNKGVDIWAQADNLKNAPGSLKNANSNVLFALQVEDLGVHVTVKKALECDIKTYDDFINKFGFNVGIVDDISKYDNIRHFFNYIEADIETITADLPEVEKMDLRTRLASIRFWNSDDIQYTLENYENNLTETI